MKFLLVVPAALAVHLLMLSMERRGWVYWTKSRGKIGKAAVGPLFDLFQPTRQTTIEEKKSEQLRRPVMPDNRKSPDEG